MKRPIRIEGCLAYVPLTKGYEAVIDAADVPLIERFSWHANVQHRAVYAARTDRSGHKPKTVTLHRLLADDPVGMEVDHRDTDGLNNRRDNLRVATTAQNQRNARISKRNTSGLKGVTFNKDRGKWHAKIMCDRRRHHIGYFGCPTAAHLAYIKASRELHGEFGRIA